MRTRSRGWVFGEVLLNVLAWFVLGFGVGLPMEYLEPSVTILGCDPSPFFATAFATIWFFGICMDDPSLSL